MQLIHYVQPTEHVPLIFRVAARIRDLSVAGVKGDALVQLATDFASALRISDGVPPSSFFDSDGRYFAGKNMANIVLEAMRSLRLDKYDQPAVQKYAARAKERCPDDSWFFRASGEGFDFLLVHQTSQQRRMMAK